MVLTPESRQWALGDASLLDPLSLYTVRVWQLLALDGGKPVCKAYGPPSWLYQDLVPVTFGKLQTRHSKVANRHVNMLGNEKKQDYGSSCKHI